MITKTFEIRDSGTFIPMMAVKLEPACERDRYLLARAGYGRDATTQSEYVYLCCINSGAGFASSDPYEWAGGTRTVPQAHKYIIENFNHLESGAVIDVEYILGEHATAKQSEQITEAY